MRGFFQNVIRQARIGSGDAVENVIERNLGVFLIAVLTRLDQQLRLAESVADSTSTTTCSSGVGSKKSPDTGIVLAFCGCTLPSLLRDREPQLLLAALADETGPGRRCR